MLVFGNNRKTRSRRRLNTEVYRPPFSRIRRYRPRIENRWGNTQTPFSVIKKKFNRIFSADDFLKQRAKALHRLQVVVDWGCGNGETLRGIAKEYGSQIRPIGFASESFPEWEPPAKTHAVNEPVFIQGTAGDFPRIFKKNTVDLIYSHLGIQYLFRPFHPGRKNRVNVSRGVNSLKRIIPALSTGGKIVFDCDWLAITTRNRRYAIKRQIEHALEGIATVEYDPVQVTFYITKTPTTQ